MGEHSDFIGKLQNRKDTRQNGWCTRFCGVSFYVDNVLKRIYKFQIFQEAKACP